MVNFGYLFGYFSTDDRLKGNNSGHLNSAQVKVHYLDVSAIQIPTVLVKSLKIVVTISGRIQ